MKHAILVVVVSAMLWVIGALWLIYPQQFRDPENTFTDYARIGIEAGINTCLTRGLPSDRKQLDAARRQARRLIERIYPEVKFDWRAAWVVGENVAGWLGCWDNFQCPKCLGG